MNAGFLLPFLLAASLFDVQVVPLGPEARPFLAASTGEKGAVYVLDDHRVTAYAAMGETCAITLEPGTSAFDIADLDGNGQTDAVAICGDRIVRYAFSAETPQPETLFRLNNQFSGHAPKPYPYALLVKKDGQHILAVPCEDTFEVRTLDGTPVVSYPIGENAPRRISYGRPFQNHAVFPTQIGLETSVENQIDRLVDFQPELPADLLPLDSSPVTSRCATSLQVRESGQLDPSEWPWFNLMMDGSGTRRVVYALAPPNCRDTLICLREVNPTERIKDSDSDMTPPKRYPGVVIVPDVPPDFNSDGYADLLLWNSAEPLLTVDSLTNAVTSGTWPVTLSVHLFSPAKGRYEPAPATRIGVSVPIAWIITLEANNPLRYCVLQDFNGDGRTDLGCSLAPNNYSVWLYTESGFSKEPEFHCDTPAAITGLAFQADLEKTDRTTIGLQTESALHILRPNSERGTRNAEF